MPLAEGKKSSYGLNDIDCVADLINGGSVTPTVSKLKKEQHRG